MLRSFFTLSSLFYLLFFLFVGCSSDDIEEAIELVEGVPRKTIDVSRLGTNAFVNDARFGSIPAQFREVRDTLGLNFVRILINWGDDVQPTPDAEPDFSFYDEIVDSLPGGVDALAVVTGVPSWMSDPANWIDGNPRTTFVRRWFRRVVARYGGNARIVGFQAWNEPNMPSVSENETLGMLTSPANYVELLASARNVIDDAAPSKLLLNAATTAINQNFSGTLDYNRGMRDAGAIAMVDVYAIHYYGQQFENVVRSGGVADFLNSLGVTIWITESGAQGPNSQLAYGEQVWPFLREKIPAIDRIYQYQFTDSSPVESSFGLRTLSSEFPVSDLYVHLRERA